MIESLSLKNFAAFKALDINLSAGINVIIGENGSGKSQLLKAAYALGSTANQIKCRTDSDDAIITQAFSDRLLRLFMPLDNQLGNLHHHGGKGKAQLAAKFGDGLGTSLNFNRNDTQVTVCEKSHINANQQSPVFFPSKEMLSIMLGFNSLYERYELSFDQTHPDMYLLLELPQVRADQRHPATTWAINEISRLTGGKFTFYGGGKVTFKTPDNEYSANAIAEGFRKIGMLARLLETGAIQPGQSGPLIWDEPEANLNPKLLRLLVEILLTLARSGQQIILASHDYVLLKWLDLLSDKEQGDNIRYHMLSRDETSGEITVNSSEDYLLVSESAISDTYAELYDQEVQRALGAK